MGDLGFRDFCFSDGILDDDSVSGRIVVERVLTRVRGAMVELHGGRWNEAATVELRFSLHPAPFMGEVYLRIWRPMSSHHEGGYLHSSRRCMAYACNFVRRTHNLDTSGGKN
jgi:hypothetical protein